MPCWDMRYTIAAHILKELRYWYDVCSSGTPWIVADHTEDLAHVGAVIEMGAACEANDWRDVDDVRQFLRAFATIYDRLWD